MEKAIYHNTTNLQGKNLNNAVAKAKTQKEKVLSLFKKYKKLFASQCYLLYKSNYKKDPPITSIRRAISDLANNKSLIITKKLITGLYQKPEHIYEII